MSQNLSFLEETIGKAKAQEMVKTMEYLTGLIENCTDPIQIDSVSSSLQRIVFDIEEAVSIHRIKSGG